MSPLRSSEIFGNWATLLLPINDDESIDYARLADQIDILISMNVNGIYSNGTAGEFYNQTEEEFDRINQLLSEKCDKAGMPFQIGCNHMSPVISLERIRRAVSLRPGAIQVILPDWYPPSFPEIISFLQKTTEAAGAIGLVLYNPPHAKKKLGPEDYGKIKDAGIFLAGCKTAGGDEQWYREMKRLIPELSVFIPGSQMATGISRGAHGSYSNVACMHPRVGQRWYEMMQSDMKTALAFEERIRTFIINDILPLIHDKKYSDAAIDKLLAAITGWAGAGTRLRWPYRWIGKEEIDAATNRCKKILPEFFPGNAVSLV